ncbi:hypothetical protein J6W78_05595 [bacterium]|nr:hypothetical protein [bacterium]
MKKILFAAFMVFAAFFIVSCAGEDEIANAIGKSCAVEGEEICSDDNSQILICRDFSWQMKKSCNLNFGQYCRQTASGSFSCTDSGNSTEPTNEPTETEPTEQEPEPEDNEPTDPEPSDNEPNDNEPADNEPTDPEPSDNEPSDDDTEPANDNDTEPVVKDLETCTDIAKCRKDCDTSSCRTECYNRGTDEAQNDYDEATQKCMTYTELDDLKKCLELRLKCGTPGDESYALPYGHAVINGSFSYINDPATTSFSQGTFIGTFVNGIFGSNGNIPDATSNATFSYAEVSTNGKYLVLNQGYDSSEENKTPYVGLIIEATAPGTYLVGVDSKSKIEMDVYEPVSSTSICYHAFGYGYLELDGTALTDTYSIGAGTITVKGEVDLYSYKNAPMYNGDITNTDVVACQPK